MSFRGRAWLIVGFMPELDIHELTPLSGILEAATQGGDVFNADGTVTMALMRPCHGRGPYNNIYETSMLQREAASFGGLPMFDNHDSPIAKKARLGLPRAPSELAGVVRESWWDPSFSTRDDQKFGFEPGAVMGKCALTDAMEALVRKIPEVVKGSLNTQASDKRMGERAGKKGWVVEGFTNDPETSSFDLVTAAGAGGRVASVLEGLYGDDNDAATQTGGNDVSDTDTTTLAEALQSEEVSDYLDAKIRNGIQEALNTGGSHDVGAIRQEIRDELAQAHRLRGMRDTAKGIIESAVLPQVAKDKLLADYGLTDGENDTVKAGPSLSVVEAVTDEAGTVTKPALEVLEAAVAADVATYRSIVTTAAPTIPRAPLSGGATGEGNDVQEAPDWQKQLAKRGVKLDHFGVAPAAATS